MVAIRIGGDPASPTVAAWVGGLAPGLPTAGLSALAALGTAISVLSDLLQRRERYARAIVESISDGLAVLDGRWRYRFLNEQAVRLTGQRRKDLIGRSIWEVFPELLGTAPSTPAAAAGVPRLR